MLSIKADKKIVKDGVNTYLELSFLDAELVEFQIDMINSNKDKGLVQVEKSIFNTTTKLKYNITKMKSLSDYIKDNVIDKEFIIKIFTDISNIIVNYNELLLENGNYLLDKDYVFINEENKKVYLINVPLTKKCTDNIEKSYAAFALDLINHIILDGKIKDGSEKFIVRLKDNIKEDVNLNEFISYIKSQHQEKEINVAEKIENKAKSMDTEQKIQYKPIVSNENIENEANVEKQVVAKPKVNKIKKENKAKEVNEEVIEKLKYKTSRLVAAIIIQPVFIGIILGLFLIKSVSLVQIGIGAVLILVIDGIIVKNLLSKEKKIKVRVKVPVKNVNSVTENQKESIERLDNKNNKKKVQQNNIELNSNQITKKETVQQTYQKVSSKDTIQPQSRETVINQPIETSEEIVNLSPNTEKLTEKPIYDTTSKTQFENSLNEETLLLDDEMTILGSTACIEINNGVTSGKEEIYTNEYIVGRSANLKEWITSKSISREHFKILNENNEFYIKDLGSKNGTKLNDIKLEPYNMKPLKDGDVIKIANLTVTFRES